MKNEKPQPEHCDTATVARIDERVKSLTRRVQVVETFFYGAICFLLSSLVYALYMQISDSLWHHTSVLSQ